MLLAHTSTVYAALQYAQMPASTAEAKLKANVLSVLQANWQQNMSECTIEFTALKCTSSMRRSAIVQVPRG
jgi:hypothetical protein